MSATFPAFPRGVLLFGALFLGSAGLAAGKGDAGAGASWTSRGGSLAGRSPLSSTVAISMGRGAYHSRSGRLSP